MMDYEQLQAAARKQPAKIWLDESSVDLVAEQFRIMSLTPQPKEPIANSIRAGLLKVLGVPVGVHSLQRTR